LISSKSKAYRISALLKIELLSNTVFLEWLEVYFKTLVLNLRFITIRGSLNYNENRQDVLNLEELRKKFQVGQPVPFVADITTTTSVKEVFIKDIEIRESENWPDYFDYFIELKEHIPDPQPSNVQASVDNKAVSGFNNMVDTAIAESSLKGLILNPGRYLP